MESHMLSPTDPPVSSSRRILALVLMLPALAACGIHLLWPTITTFSLSTQAVHPMGNSEPVGLLHYRELLSHPSLYSSLRFTGSLTLARVAVVAIFPPLLGVGAIALGRRGRRIVRLLLTVPISLCLPVIIATSWRAYLATGASPTAAGLLARPETAASTVVLVDALLVGAMAAGIGFVAYSAALPGASDKRGVLGRPFLLVWVISVATAIASGTQAFTFSQVLTGGGPALATQTLMRALYQQGFQRLDLGPASAIGSLLLLPLLLLSLLIGIAIVLSGVGLEERPESESGAEPSGAAGRVALAVGLLGAGGLTLVAGLPLSQAITRGVDGGALAQLSAQYPPARIYATTLIPIVAGVFLTQLPLAYSAGMAIGALRPLGRRSELLLLPFSPWLLVGVGPLAIALFLRARDVGLVGTSLGLVPPLTMSVPLLFALTLYFRGRYPHWRRECLRGASPLPSFLRTVVVPSLPFTALVGLAAVFAHMGELLWPTLIAMRPDSFPVNVVLTLLGSHPDSGPLMTAGLVVLGVPLILASYALFGLFQLLYVGRLRLSGPAEH